MRSNITLVYKLRYVCLTYQKKKIMPHFFEFILQRVVGLMALVGFATILFCCWWFLVYLNLCSLLCCCECEGDQQIYDRHDEDDSRPYELPIIDPNATAQDHPNRNQLQVNLPPSASRIKIGSGGSSTSL